MITAIRVRNLRSIGDSHQIRLAKINIFVGRNSAGKSTLLRVLPLLRQSVERPTKGPLLWYGRLVDFGSFQNAVNSSDRSKGVVFDFSMSLAGASHSMREGDSDDPLWGATEVARFYKPIGGAHASLTVGSDAQDEVGKTRSLSVSLGSDSIELVLESSILTSVKVNGSAVALPQGRRWHVQPGKILPIPMVLREESYEEAGATRNYLTYELRPFSDYLVSSLVPLFHGNTSRERIAEFASTLLYASEESFFEQLKSQASISSSFAANLSGYTQNSYYVKQIRQAVLLASLSGVIRRMDREIYEFASSVKYVEPIRATAERYYRHQDLAVDEIDSRGENAAMFIGSLDAREKDSLKNWMLTNLGFYADVEQGSGHVQVKIGTPAGGSKNIADLGFGYSQLLPIILQVWRSLVARPSSRLRSEARAVMAIEQPELHLHPRFQAQIADVLAAVLSDSKRRVQAPVLFIETHSEHLVNRIGHLIAAGKLKKNDVQVLVVEGGEGDVSSVKNVNFDDRGFLGEGWPVGFFVPEI